LISIGFPATIHVVNDHEVPMYRFGVSGLAGVRLAKELDWTPTPKGEKRSRRYNHIKMTSGCSLHPIRSIGRVEYAGDLVNLEVEERHTYCVPFVVHNCWIEKDALIGVISKVCKEYDVPYFSCRGYTSQSSMWQAGEGRLRKNHENGQTTLIIHLADHDPSGIDMTRDIDDRLTLFAGWGKHDIDRIALNMSQVSEFNPPPNPTKLTDSRAKAYIVEFGHNSWELDALEPRVIADLIQDTLDAVIDLAAWDEIEQRITHNRKTLKAIADKYEEVQQSITETGEAG